MVTEQNFRKKRQLFAMSRDPNIDNQSWPITTLIHCTTSNKILHTYPANVCDLLRTRHTGSLGSESPDAPIKYVITNNIKVV